MQILTFLGFTILVAVISYLTARKTVEDPFVVYFLGGRRLTICNIANKYLFTAFNFHIRNQVW
jgi:SSS family solute:Na+ symporter